MFLGVTLLTLSAAAIETNVASTKTAMKMKRFFFDDRVSQNPHDIRRSLVPNHYHTANEEAVFVLEGKGHVRIGKEEIANEAGDYIAFPVGPETAHSIRNTSSGTLKMPRKAL